MRISMAAARARPSSIRSEISNFRIVQASGQLIGCRTVCLIAIHFFVGASPTSDGERLAAILVPRMCAIRPKWLLQMRQIDSLDCEYHLGIRLGTCVNWPRNQLALFEVRRTPPGIAHFEHSIPHMVDFASRERWRRRYSDQRGMKKLRDYPPLLNAGHRRPARKATEPAKVADDNSLERVVLFARRMRRAA